MENKRRLKQLAIHTIPLVVGVALSYFFWKEKNILFWMYVLIVLILVLSGKDKKNEFLVFVYGLIIGFVIEAFGTQVSGYQKFTYYDFWGIPYWLLIAWGYGFILMKRIGLIIARGTPWFHRKHTVVKINDFKISK